ncbi:hypothetical protein Hanom_Chr16g01425221 [Helianthus anomalus]
MSTANSFINFFTRIPFSFTDSSVSLILLLILLMLLTDLVIASFALFNFSTGGKSSENFNKRRLKLSKSRVSVNRLTADEIKLHRSNTFRL